MRNLFESILDDFDDINQATDNYILEQWIGKYCSGDFNLRYTKKGIIIKKGTNFIIKNCHDSKLPSGLVFTTTASHEIKGNIKIINCDFESLDGMFDDNCWSIAGDLIIENCTKLKVLGNLPHSIHGDFSLFGNKSLKKLDGMPWSVYGTFYVMKNGKKFTKEQITKFGESNYDVFMVHNIENLNESLLNEDIEMVDESLSNPHLLMLEKQLKKDNIKISYVFSGITLDKITSDNIEVYDINKIDKNQNTILTKCRNIISGSKYGYILLKNANGKFTGVINNYKQLINLNNSYDNYYMNYNSTKLIDFCKKAWTIILVYYTMDDTTFSIIADRRNAREGMIYNNPEYYKKVAKENIKRYKKIIEKNKVFKVADKDTYNKKVEECVMKALKAATLFNSNVEKYSQISYKLDEIMSNIYGEARWNNKGGQVGKNGLLYYYNKYCQTIASIYDGESWRTNSDIEEYKKAMDSRISTISYYLNAFGL